MVDACLPYPPSTWLCAEKRKTADTLQVEVGVGKGENAGGTRPTLVINFDPALARALASKGLAHSVFAAVKISVAKASAEKGASASATIATSAHALSLGDACAI